VTVGLIFIGAFVLALGLTPLVRLVAVRMGIVDHPERRKMHQVPVPLLGGAAIVASFFLVTLGVWYFLPDLLADEVSKLPALMAGALAISLLGVYDDWKGARVWVKFAFQTVAAGIVVMAGVKADVFTNPLGESFQLGWLGIPLTIFWIVGVTNAMNLIDGLDGLAAGTGAIASLALCAVGALSGDPLVAILSLTLAGACLGFLPFNLYPARIFLGDTGSMFLGFILAGLGVAGSFKATAATVLILPIVVLGVPVFDTLWAILRRTRRNMNPFIPDRDHIHHRLVRIGLHHRHVVLVLYFVCIFLGVSAYIMAQLPYQTSFLFAVVLGLAGILGVSTLQFIEEHLEERLAVAASSSSGSRRMTPPPETSKVMWQSANGGRQPAGIDYQIGICEIAGFREGLSGSQAFGSVAKGIRESLGRSIKVYAVGAYMQEDLKLLLVLKTQPLGADGLNLVKDGLTMYFDDAAEKWGSGGTYPDFRWIRTGQEHPEAVAPSEEGTNI
jgi:UDP-GlcNAc:undecaprenyl-phosphate GlcNAc-1-phosphate transferase